MSIGVAVTISATGGGYGRADRPSREPFLPCAAAGLLRPALKTLSSLRAASARVGGPILRDLATHRDPARDGPLFRPVQGLINVLKWILCRLIGCLSLPPLASAPPQRRGGCHCRPCHAHGCRRRSACHQEQRSPWWRLFGPARGAVNPRWQAQCARDRGLARSRTTNDRAIRARPFLPAHAARACWVPLGRQAGPLACTNPPGHTATTPHVRGLRAPLSDTPFEGGGGRACPTLCHPPPCKSAGAAAICPARRARPHRRTRRWGSRARACWPPAAAGHARFVLSAAGATTPLTPRGACAAAAAAAAATSASTSEPPTLATHAPSARLSTAWLQRSAVSGWLTFGGRPLFEPERFSPRS